MKVIIVILLVILVPLYTLNAHDNYEHHHMDSPYVWIPMTALMVTVGYLLLAGSRDKKDAESAKMSRGYLDGKISLDEYFKNKENIKSY